MNRLCVKGSGVSFAVYRKDARLTKFYINKGNADIRLDQMRKDEQSQDRNCMRCCTVFRSEGAHHRLCNECRKQNFDPAMLSGSAVLV